MTASRPDPLVSVIIPVYNGARFLDGAIRNVLEQAYTPLEIIVVDDGSTDSPAEIAARFGDAVRYIYQDRRGPAAARNRGIGLATGDILAFFDVDDRWPRGKLRRQVGYLRAHPEVAIVQGLIVQMQIDLSAPAADAVFEECSEPYQFVNLGSAVFRRTAFATAGLFDESLWENEDTDWFVRAWEHNLPKVTQDQVALYYRRHDANMTLAQRHPNLRIMRVFKRHLDRARAGGPAAAAAAARPSIARYIGSPPVEMYKPAIRDERFTIIANDCWGGGPYGHGNLMYRTPFVGIRILAPCYLELLHHLPRYLASPLEFIAGSKYDFINDRREAFLGFYPIARLGGRVEVHFVHEDDAATAQQKWQRRLAKMNWDNLFIKFSQDPEVCTDALLEEFDRLPYPYKVCFTYQDYPALRSTVTMPDYFVAGAPMYFLSRQYFDAIGWINQQHGPDTQAYRLPGAVRVG